MSIAYFFAAGFGYFVFTKILWDGMLRYGGIAVAGVKSPRLTVLAAAVLSVCIFFGFISQYLRIIAWGAEWAGWTN